MHAHFARSGFLFFLWSPNLGFGQVQAPHSLVAGTMDGLLAETDSITTSMPSPLCEIQLEDPGQGIYDMFCTCDKTISLPLLTPTPDNGNKYSSCGYQSYPAGVKSSPHATSTGTTNTLHTPSNSSHAVFSITAAPSHESKQGRYSNATSTGESTCVLSEPYCSFRGPEHALDGLRESCMLWDPECPGNKSMAMENMPFEVMNQLYNNPCFSNSTAECSARNPPGRMSEFDKVRSWMRSPQCRSSSAEYKVLHGYASDIHHLGAIDKPPYFSCCYVCQLEVYNADVYYFPSPDMDTSCQSIIGDKRLPLENGATYEEVGYGPNHLSTVAYWGCVTWMTTSTPYPVIWQNTVTLATVATLGSMTTKQHLYNPWLSNSSLCSSYRNISEPPSSLPGYEVQEPIDFAIHKPLKARAHSLVGTTGHSGQRESTMVLDGFTL